MRITADCAPQTGASMAVSFRNKNLAQLVVHLLHITAGCARRKNKIFFKNKPEKSHRSATVRDNYCKIKCFIVKIENF